MIAKALIVILAGLPFIVSTVTSKDVPMGPAQLIAWAAVVSGSVGLVAGWRVTNVWAEIVKTGLNTAAMGVVLVLLSANWTLRDNIHAWSAIGVSGALALGGLSGVEWAVLFLKKRIARKADNVLDEIDPPGRGR